MAYSQALPSHVNNPNKAGGFFEEEYSNGKSQYLFPSTSHSFVNHLLHPTTTGSHTGIMVEDGIIGAPSKSPDDGRGCPHGNNYPKPSLPSMHDDPPASPEFGKLWIPPVDVHTVACSIHGDQQHLSMEELNNLMGQLCQTMPFFPLMNLEAPILSASFTL